MRTLPSYILRAHLVPFLIGFGVVTFIIEMDALFDYLDLIISQGVPVGTVFELFALILGFVVALSVPCAVLVAVLMTFGRLSQDNEITALRASGVHLFRVILPVLIAAGVLATGLTLFNNHVYPETNHRLANLLIDIHRMRPTVKLQEGVFINDFPGYNLLVQSIQGESNDMRGVTIYQMNAGGPPTTILAERGHLSYTPDGNTAVLELQDGEIHEVPAEAEGPRRYHRLTFRTHTIYMQNLGQLVERSVRASRGDREKSARMLLDERQDVRAQYRASLELRRERFRAADAPEADIARLAPEFEPWSERLSLALERITRPAAAESSLARHPDLALDADLWRTESLALRRRMAVLSVEIHKKFALPVACIVFVLIGAPIGMRVKRAGPAVAFVSIGFFLFYYLCLVGGEELAIRLIMPAWVAMWLANIVLGAIGVVLTLEACDVRMPWHRVRRALPRGVPAAGDAVRVAG